MSAASGDLFEERDRIKAQIKSLTKARKAVPKENIQAKAELSTTIKAAKRALHAVEQQISAPSPSDNVPSEPPSEIPRTYDGKINIVDDTAGWATFTSSHTTSLYHDLRWQRILEDVMGRETKYLTARDQTDQVIGVLPLAITRSRLFGEYAVSLPYFNYGGPAAIANNVEEALLDHAFSNAESWQLDNIEIRDTKARPNRTARLDKIAMVLDVSPFKAIDELHAFLSSKVRAQVNKALASDIAFTTGGLELLDDFYGVFATNMRDLGTPVYSKSLFRAILETFTDDAKLVVGYLNNRPVSCAFLLNHDGHWEIPWASTLRKVNHLSANMALYATVLHYVIDNGGRSFDFGRSSKDSPTYRFKKQWKAEPKQLYWYNSDPNRAATLTTSNPKYDMAIGVWKRLPLFLTNAVGPHLVRNLP